MAEFRDLIEGYKWRNRREWEKIAQHAVWTSNRLRKGTTAKKLLGNAEGKKKTTAQESQAEVAALTETLGQGLKISH